MRCGAVLYREGILRAAGCRAKHRRMSSKTFSDRFDESSKSGIYCKAPLNTAATHREAKEDNGDAAKAVQKHQTKNSMFLTRLQKLCHNTRLS